MRVVSILESRLIGAGSEAHRNEIREFAVDASLAIGPFVLGDIGLAATSGMGLAYGLGGYVVGAFAGIIAVPVLVKMGVELSFIVHDALV